MTRFCLFGLALASLFSSFAARAASIVQDFSTDPLQNGWKVFGNPEQFQWDSRDQALEVTWDSRETNSYFYHPLGTTLTRSDDFSVEFDLRLRDIASGIEVGKTGGLEIGVGFLNLAGATSTNFQRGAFGSAPGLVEFDYFPPGYYEFGGMLLDVPATTTPTFISTNAFDFAPTIFAPYEFELPTNVTVHVALTYSASEQTLTTELTTNGLPLFRAPNVVLTDTNQSGFVESDDYRVDAFAIASYSSAGDDYDSVLAHGVVDNIHITFPLPIQNIVGGFSNTVWQVQFGSRSHWLYGLERTADFQSWSDSSTELAGNDGVLVLSDVAPPAGKASYRVRARRP
jgi:hypothetical protein